MSIGRLQPELTDPRGPPTGRGGKQTYIPEDLRHVCGNLHGWDTKFSHPEPGNHHAIHSHLHTLDDLSTTADIFSSMFYVPVLIKSPCCSESPVYIS